MIRPQSSMSKHIPVSIRRSAASGAGAPRPAPPSPPSPLFRARRPLPTAPARSSGGSLAGAGRNTTPWPDGGAGCGDADAGVHLVAGWRLNAGGTGFLIPAEPGGDGGTAAGPERRVGAVSATAAGRAGRHKSRFVTAASALGPPVWRACPGPGGLRGVPRPLCLAERERPAWEAGDVARGGARAARVTAEPDTGRARRRGRHRTRAGVG